MVQYGQNAGPRHLRFFGYVRNIKARRMQETDRIRKDRNLLGVFGLVWNLLRANLPEPTITACEDAMDRAGLPRMGTMHDQSGKSVNYISRLQLTVHRIRIYY